MRSKLLAMFEVNTVVCVILFLGFISCTKQDYTVVEKQESKVEISDSSEQQLIPLEGLWILRSGKLFLENLETNEKTVYNHFDSTAHTSRNSKMSVPI